MSSCNNNKNSRDCPDKTTRKKECHDRKSFGCSKQEFEKCINRYKIDCHIPDKNESIAKEKSKTPCIDEFSKCNSNNNNNILTKNKALNTLKKALNAFKKGPKFIETAIEETKQNLDITSDNCNPSDSSYVGPLTLFDNPTLARLPIIGRAFKPYTSAQKKGLYEPYEIVDPVTKKPIRNMPKNVELFKKAYSKHKSENKYPSIKDKSSLELNEMSEILKQGKKCGCTPIDRNKPKCKEYLDVLNSLDQNGNNSQQKVRNPVRRADKIIYDKSNDDEQKKEVAIGGAGNEEESDTYSNKPNVIKKAIEKIKNNKNTTVVNDNNLTQGENNKITNDNSALPPNKEVASSANKVVNKKKNMEKQVNTIITALKNKANATYKKGLENKDALKNVSLYKWRIRFRYRKSQIFIWTIISATIGIYFGVYKNILVLIAGFIFAYFVHALSIEESLGESMKLIFFMLLTVLLMLGCEATLILLQPDPECPETSSMIPNIKEQFEVISYGLCGAVLFIISLRGLCNFIPWGYFDWVLYKLAFVLFIIQQFVQRSNTIFLESAINTVANGFFILYSFNALYQHLSSSNTMGLENKYKGLVNFADVMKSSYYLSNNSAQSGGVSHEATEK